MSFISTWLRARRIPTLLLLAGILFGALTLTARITSAASISVSTAAIGSATTFKTPLDAAPNPAGDTFYFVAQTPAGSAGVFSVPAGGGAVTTVFSGSPLVAPRGIVVSSDGGTLYVADPNASGGGAVFAIPAGGSSATAVSGTQGTKPRALDLVKEGASDVLYVAGVDPQNGRAGVWRVPAAGGSRTSVMTGSPLAFADGVAVASNGTVYVAGRTGNSASSAVVLQVDRRGHKPIVRNVTLGAPAGIALTKDESTLLVSSLAADGTSQVLIVDLASGSTSTFNGTIGAGRSSGGLHRAQSNNTFAWCGVTVGNGGQGTVFRVTLT